jgi:hypothetical protein
MTPVMSHFNVSKVIGVPTEYRIDRHRGALQVVETTNYILSKSPECRENCTSLDPEKDHANPFGEN